MDINHWQNVQTTYNKLGTSMLLGAGHKCRHSNLNNPCPLCHIRSQKLSLTMNITSRKRQPRPKFVWLIYKFALISQIFSDDVIAVILIGSFSKNIFIFFFHTFHWNTWLISIKNVVKIFLFARSSLDVYHLL